MADPQVRWRESITTIEDEDLGELAMQNTVYRFSRSTAKIRHGGRRLGQDNADVYGSLLGLTPEDLLDLEHAG